MIGDPAVLLPLFLSQQALDIWFGAQDHVASEEPDLGCLTPQAFGVAGENLLLL